MDSINQFLQTLFQIALCVGPFLVLGAIIAGMVLYNDHSKRQRKERLATAIQGAKGLMISGLAGDTGTFFSNDMANCANLLSGFTRGELAALEQRALDRFTQSLQSYRQQAAFGALPNQVLEDLRSTELHHIDSLRAAITRLIQAAEAGDANSLKQNLQDSAELLSSAHQNHLTFFQRLKDEGVAFPIQPPALITTASTSMTSMQGPELVPIQILQQLPEEKQALFVMQYNSVKKTPSTAVLLAVLLGGVGAHKFYLGQVGLGIVYLLFSWTWIPMILGVLEAFTISGYVNQHNAQKALEIAALLGATSSR